MQMDMHWGLWQGCDPASELSRVGEDWGANAYHLSLVVPLRHQEEALGRISFGLRFKSVSIHSSGKGMGEDPGHDF